MVKWSCAKSKSELTILSNRCGHSILKKNFYGELLCWTEMQVSVEHTWFCRTENPLQIISFVFVFFYSLFFHLFCSFIFYPLLSNVLSRLFSLTLRVVLLNLHSFYSLFREDRYFQEEMMNLSRPSSGSSSSKRFSSRIEQNEATRVLDDASRYEKRWRRQILLFSKRII